jgi:hypothetical protein
MADPTTTTPTDQTGPLDAGHTTTEYKVSMLATILGALATVVGYASTILDVLPQELKWVGVATAIVGMLTACLTALGYTVTRGGIKKAALAASTAPPNATAAAAAKNLGA